MVGLDQQVWYQVTCSRRTGWVKNTDIEEVPKSIIIKERKSLNLTGMTEREKDKARLFYQYDFDKREREFQEVLGADEFFINRPIKRSMVSKGRVDDFKEEVYSKIVQIRNRPVL